MAVIDIRRSPYDNKDRYKTKQGNNFAGSAEELKEIATCDFSKTSNSEDRLIVILDVLKESIPVIEGYFRRRPSQSSAYALSNLINQLQDVENQINGLKDLRSLTNPLMEQTIQPFFESLVLELGKLIKEELNNYEDFPPKKKNRIKKSFNTIFKEFGKVSKNKLNELSDKISDFLIEIDK